MNNRRSKRQIRVRGIRRDPIDVQKLGKALLALAMAQAKAEAEAEAEHENKAKENPQRAA